MANFDWVMDGATGGPSTLRIASYYPQSAEIILFDTGAAVHACPATYAAECPLLPYKGNATLRSVTGQHMNIYGTRCVPYLFPNGLRVKINYVVTDVHMPIVSATSLLNSGFSMHLAAHQSLLSKDSLECPIYREGSLLYLRPLQQLEPRESVLLAPIGATRNKYEWRLQGD